MKKDGLDPFGGILDRGLIHKFSLGKAYCTVYGLQPVQIHQSIKGFCGSRLFFTTSKRQNVMPFAGMRIARVYGEIHGFCQ